MTNENENTQQQSGGESLQNEGNMPPESNQGMENPENGGTDLSNPDNNEQKNEPPVDDNEGEIYGKPDSYDFSGVDIGENMELEPETTKEFTELAGKCNLSQKTADEFIRLGASLVNKSISQIKGQQIEAYKIALNTDKEIGGTKLNAAIDEAELAYSKFATPELINVFNETGLKYHPEVIKTFRNIGAMMKEAKILDGVHPAEKDLTPAQILYGNNQ